ncbi:MAG TPA: hypothetical protein VGL57_01905, partial [Solirubrobacteraceae bacterium]
RPGRLKQHQGLTNTPPGPQSPTPTSTTVTAAGSHPSPAATLRDTHDEKQACEQIITSATNRQATSGTLH